MQNEITQVVINEELLNALSTAGVTAQEATSALSKISSMWRDVL